MFVVNVVCCQVQVSATDWSLVQRSTTDCGASLRVSRNLENEEAKARYRAVKIQPQWVVTPGKKQQHDFSSMMPSLKFWSPCIMILIRETYPGQRAGIAAGVWCM